MIFMRYLLLCMRQRITFWLVVVSMQHVQLNLAASNFIVMAIDLNFAHTSAFQPNYTTPRVQQSVKIY